MYMSVSLYICVCDCMRICVCQCVYVIICAHMCVLLQCLITRVCFFVCFKWFAFIIYVYLCFVYACVFIYLGLFVLLFIIFVFLHRNIIKMFLKKISVISSIVNYIYKN